MIRVLADENMVGLDLLPQDELHIRTIPGRSIEPADLKDIDVLWVRSVTQVTETLVQDSQLKFVGTATAGLEHIDQEALKARGIGFSAAPGANANSVVEYVIAALAELEEPLECLERGEALGIVGCGAVGSLLLAVAESLGWVVKVYDPWRESRESKEKGVSQHWASLAEVLTCPVISLHCSLHNEQPWPSHHLIGAEALKHLNGRQWLINAARGAVLDNRALREHLGGPDPVNCVLDVWEGEPDCDWALLDSPALKIATAHIAGYSWDAKWQATKMLYRSLCDAGLATKAIADENGSEEPLKAISSLEGAIFVQQLITQRYKISEDNVLFRELTGLDSGKRSAGFDALRRHYRRRRELRGSRLLMPQTGLSPKAQVIAESLGVLMSPESL